MTVVNVWEGIPSPTELPVVAKISGAAARLAVWDNEDLSGTPTFHDPVEGPTAEDIVRFVADDLAPAAEYWWQVEVDSVIDTTYTGRARTLPLPGTPFSFTVAAGGCAGGQPENPAVGAVLAPNFLSNHPVFDTIRATQPLFFAHLGDFTYYDPGRDPGRDSVPAGAAGATVEIYRRMFDDLLLQPRQHQLYQQTPLWLGHDDHDRGFNDHDETFPWGGNYEQVHRERVPFLPGDLPSSTATFRARQVGRVLFAMADTRSARSPNSDPDNASKTMLGDEQKTWLRGVLESSDAELFVWFMPSQWIGRGAADTWDGYTVERDQLVQMFTQTGWIDRMCIVGGDMHDLAIDTGGNSAGGIPVFQFASMDSDFGVPKGGYDTGPTNPGRNQWGTLGINDDGEQIRVTGSGMIGSSLWNSHTFIVGSAPTPPPDPGGLPQVAQAEIRTRVTWLSCDLASGQVITELPDLGVDSISRVIGRYTSSSLSLPIPTAGTTEMTLGERALLADTSTQPPRTMIVAVINDIPTAAIIPLGRDRGTDATMPISCVSLEGYLEHRVVRDHTWTQVDESVIVAGLLGDAEDIGGLGQGIGLIVDAPPTGTLRDRQYQLTDRKSVYEALTELMGVINGPEWTIAIDWRAGFQGRIVDKIFRLRKQLGVVTGEPEAIFSSAVFSSQGTSDASYLLKEDFSSGRYANYVVAYSSGEGEDQPASVPAVDTAALDSGIPIWEKHFQPSSSITTQSVLDDHATAELGRVRDGYRIWEITAQWQQYPRYGVDWQLGDTIGYELKGHAHPDGVAGMARAIGFRLQIVDGTISPILQEEI